MVRVFKSKARAIELVLSKHKLQAELSEEEFGKLVEVHLKWRKCKIHMLGLIRGGHSAYEKGGGLSMRGVEVDGRVF